jgi:hypothetical protein
VLAIIGYITAVKTILLCGENDDDTKQEDSLAACPENVVVVLLQFQFQFTRGGGGGGGGRRRCISGRWWCV